MINPDEYPYDERQLSSATMAFRAPPAPTILTHYPDPSRQHRLCLYPPAVLAALDADTDSLRALHTATGYLNRCAGGADAEAPGSSPLCLVLDPGHGRTSHVWLPSTPLD